MTAAWRRLSWAPVLLGFGGIAYTTHADADRPPEHHSSTVATREAALADRARMARMRWEADRRRAAAHARMPDTMYASTPSGAVRELSCPVPPRQDARRVLQSLTSADDLPRSPLPRGDARGPDRGLGRLAPLGGGRASSADGREWSATPHEGRSAVFAAAGDSGATMHLVPMFPAASDPTLQGFARVVNHSSESGEVSILAFDDEGTRHGPLTLSINAGETVPFNSDDLEAGNAAKGLTGSAGAGQGDWHLELTSELDVEVLSYIRTVDGFLTAMHDLAPVEGNAYRIAIFNPGSNDRQVSRLRLINPGEAEARVSIVGVDDRGMSPGGTVAVTVAARATRTLTAAELESGGAGMTGALGDGAGKWRLTVTAEEQIDAMSLLASPTGHLTNLSTAPALRDGHGVHHVSMFPAASDATLQGFARVRNRGDTEARVTIRAYDDTDWEYEPLTLTVAPGTVAPFNSDDLERGNAGKGLAGSTGSGQGDWRLELSSESDIEVLSYIRTTDGFLTAMHDAAPVAGNTHRVSMFNPGSNDRQVSRLRLVNAGEDSAAVTITGVDDRGASPGGAVRLTLPAGKAREYTAAELESGGTGMDGGLGDGAGKWRLEVTSDVPVRVLSLLSSPTGHLTNLSTAASRAGGMETAREVFRTLVSPIVQSQCVNCHVEGGPSGHTRLVFVTKDDADHLATNFSVFETFVAEVEDAADYILNKVRGVGHGGGVQLAAGTDGFSAMERFLGLLEGEEAGPATITPANLFDGVKLESWRSTLRRAAIILAGRNPTEAEYESVRGATANDLRAAIRDLMEGPGFHEFLIRAANDRLLTDRERTVLQANSFSPFVAYMAELHRLATLDGDRFGEGVVRWDTAVQYGARRAPLELLAHVVENDLPYTEVLLADYVMANPQAARAYGASTDFDGSEDPHDFRPSRIEEYHRLCRGREYEWTDLGFRVVDPGPCPTVHPHIGVVNTKAFLQRYPTTATNRNRARSRWTYYHFLGVDVERSAARTTDPNALADTDNPTLRNPACTVCHAVLDPVAASYRDYGNEGRYLDSYGGLDALDDTYKHDTPVRLEVSATTWGDREAVSFVSGTVDAGMRDILLRSLSVTDAASRYHGWMMLDRLELRAVDYDWAGVFELEEMAGYELACGDTGLIVDGERVGARVGARGCVARVEIPRDGRYEVVVHAQYRPERTVCPLAGGDCVEDEGGPNAQLGVLIEDFFRDGDRWYRGMRGAGLGTARSPDDEDSLHWLALRIAEDHRFAESTVKFWWPAVMGREVLAPPEDEGDAGFEALLIATGAQHAEVGRLARGFRRGFRGRSPYNLKDLLVELAVSRWFRAEAAVEPGALRQAALAGAGARRLLTPEELARKTGALTGYRWGRRVDNFVRTSPDDFVSDSLTGTYRLMYGGIDSEAVTERARDMTSVMLAVAETHAVEASCPIVLRELYLLDDHRRRLFGGIDATVSPATDDGADAIKRKLADLHETLMGVRVGVDSEDVRAAWELFVDVWRRHGDVPNRRFLSGRQCAWFDDIRYFDGILEGAAGVRTSTYLDQDGEERQHEYYGFDYDLVNEFLHQEVAPADPEGTAAAWVVVLAFLMSDHRYLHL